METIKTSEFKKLKIKGGRYLTKINKFGNYKLEYNGIKFDSKKEMQRYQELKLLEKAKKINNLRLQTTLPITINGIKICSYKSDFDYMELPSRKWVVEDTKGFKTGIYKLKKKLVKAVYSIDILES